MEEVHMVQFSNSAPFLYCTLHILFGNINASCQKIFGMGAFGGEGEKGRGSGRGEINGQKLG